MATRALTPANVPKTYAELRNAVEKALLEGQRRVDEAKLRTYWETGWFIKEHLLLNEDRAEYGKRVMRDLAHDLKTDRRTLYECVKFARVFPIVGRHPQLAWAHYRRFIQVADPGQRKALVAQTLKEGWTGDEVAARVVEINASVKDTDQLSDEAERAPQPLLKPNRGTPGLHRIVEKSIGLSVDLGFRHYWLLSPEQKKRFAKGDIVRVASDDSLRPAENAARADLFTYRAQLLRVIDGDTLVVALEISPGVFFEQTLRLRGLDCAELATPGGKAAKRLVEATLTPATWLTINTTKPDKYDRYLADVFVDGPEGGTEIFLNNLLLEKGHATRKDAWEFGDWGYE